MGRAFHRLVGDWIAGAPIDPQDVEEDDPALGDIWRQFVNRPPDLRGGRKILEQEITLSVETALVVARPDLIWLTDDGRLTIYDWKTGPPTFAGAVAESCQALLYPYLLVEASGSLGLGSVEPARIEMFFHFVTQPDRTVQLQHSDERHELIGAWLRRRVNEILETPDFPKTSDLAECSRCRYQTYCHVGGVDLGPQTVEDEAETSPPRNLDYF